MTTDAIKVKGLFGEAGEVLLIAGVLGVVLLMVIPLPPFLLDVLLVMSIAFSVLILIVGLYSYKPLDFSVFPTLLLFSTLLRLTLNIASTRLILLHGAEGDAAAGQVIRAFGYFVAGGNYVVGFVVFIILVMINFIVITKGAGRIAEVAARFTLDSMPGKQLAIDADLNAGIINDKEARRRRETLEREADFYGAMDGASKFVRGDAIAGILITSINVVGGLIIGMVQQGLPLVEAAKIYTILTVGDGLVAQIPALIVSTSAGLIVTKVSKQQRLSAEIGSQTLANWRPLGMAGIVLLCLGLVPSLPHIPFLFLALMLGGVAYFAWHREQQKTATEQVATDKTAAESVTEQQVGVKPLDLIEVEVGYDLIPVVDQRSGGEFPARVIGIRRQFANEMGVLLSPVHIRDNLKLKPNEYRIFLKGAVVGQGVLMPHHSLALDPGMTTRRIEGIPTTDPTFGLDALWIPDERKEAAMVAGYTVVDLPSVMATHLVEIVRRNLHELFGRQDLSSLLEQMKATHPKVVNELIPDLLPFGTVLRVLQNLLRERVSIRDLLTILEALAEHAPYTKDPAELTEHARCALGRAIVQQYRAADEQLYVITLDRQLEEILMQSITPAPGGSQLAVDPNTARKMVERLGEETKRNIGSNQPPVVLTSQQIRAQLYRLVERFIPNLAILSHAEVAGHAPVRPVGAISLQ